MKYINFKNIYFLMMFFSICLFTPSNSYAQMSWDELSNRVIAVTKQLGELEKYVYNNPDSFKKNPKDLSQNNSLATGQQKRLDSIEAAVKELRGIIEIEYIKQKQLDELEIKISELKNIIENELQILRQNITKLDNQFKSIDLNAVNSSSTNNLNLENFNNQLLVLNDKIRIIDSRINTALDFIGKSEVRIMRIESLVNSGIVTSNNNKIITDNIDNNLKNKDDGIPKTIQLDEAGNVDVSKESQEGSLGLLSISDQENSLNVDENIIPEEDSLKYLPDGTAEEQFKYALELALKRNFNEAELALSEFMRIHPEDDRIQDAHFWYGGVLFRQQKYEESAFNDIDFNDKYPNDPRTVDTTLRIAQAMSYVAQPDQACTVFENSLNFIVNPPERFVRKINELKADKACD